MLLNECLAIKSKKRDRRGEGRGGERESACVKGTNVIRRSFQSNEIQDRLQQRTEHLRSREGLEQKYASGEKVWHAVAQAWQGGDKQRWLAQSENGGGSRVAGLARRNRVRLQRAWRTGYRAVNHMLGKQGCSWKAK